MKDAKNGGKNFYCIEHYLKKQEKEEKVKVQNGIK